MKLEIKRGAAVNVTVSIDERTVMSHRLLGEDVVNATLKSKSALDIAIKDYIVHEGKNYYINNLPQVKKFSSLNYEYTAVFESLQYQLLKTQYLSSGLSEFDLVGDADDFMDLIITNLNRVDSGWTKGTVKSTNAIHLSFREESCLAVIQRLASEFECEFELSTKEIKFTDIGSDSGLSFSYGKNKGLYDLTRQTVSSKNIVTRLYAYGSERNLDKDYRTYSKRLMFDAAGSNYVENNVATYGLIEAVKIFEEVYPHREGTISWVDAGDVKVFRDSGIDFDVNSYLIEGVSAKIHFNTGNLAGFEFELTSYEHGDKEFVLLKNSNIQDYELPSATLKPAIGDKYVILDITMPAGYITTAESDLTTKATDFINENSDPRVNYLLTPDPKYFKDNVISLKVGDKVTIVDSELSIDKLVRIIRLTQSLYNPYEYTLEFSDYPEPQTLQRLIAEQKEIGRKIIISDVGDIQKARRNWRSIAELHNIIFDPDDYFDTGNIRPLSIETSMLTVGNKSQQFFLKDVIMQPNYTGDAAKFEVSAGSLIHFTIDAAIKVWTLSSNSYNSLVAGTVYYIYARCNRADNAGQIILDTTQRKIDDGSTYYYFLVGVLHSVSDSVRCISLTYGFTRINGKFITTGEIKSQDGNTKFNLDTGVITGKITFIAGTTGYSNIGDKPISLNDISTSEFDAYEAKIKTFIQSAAPTAENVGDLWHDTDDDTLYRWSGSVWVETVDLTSTTIDGGLITSGRIELGSGGTIRAGINGYGTSGSEIRLWAGDTYANRATAPFRVNQDGEIFSTKGTIGGWTLATDAIYTGTKHTADGFSTTGVTIASNGSIHAPNFYLNIAGDVGIRELNIIQTKAIAGFNMKFEGCNIYEEATNALGRIYINRVGYAGASTQYRDTFIGNGKTGILFQANGSPNAWGGTLLASAPLGIWGGLSSNVNYRTTGETINQSDYVTIVNSGSAQTITLPASPINGEQHFIKRAGSGGVTIAGNGKQITSSDGDHASISITDYRGTLLVYSTSYGKWSTFGLS